RPLVLAILGDAFVAAAERAQVGEAVDSRIVPVAPDEAERVVADLLDVPQLQIAAGHEARLVLAAGDELDRPRMALAGRTGAIAAEDLVRVDALVPVGPGDLEAASAAGR